MLDWIRKFPHPTLKPCGGAKYDCAKYKKPKPEWDWMQVAFWKHDLLLNKATKKNGKDWADHCLALQLRKGDPKKLLEFYKRFYLLISKLVFKPLKRYDRQK